MGVDGGSLASIGLPRTRSVRISRMPRRIAPPQRSRAAFASTLIDLAATLVSVGLGLVLIESAVGLTAQTAGLLLVSIPILLLSLRLQGMYRGSYLRLVPCGISVVTKVAKALPLAALGTVAVLLAGGTAPGSSSLAMTAAVLLPALAFIPLVRSLVLLLGSRSRLGRHQRVLIVGSGEAALGVAVRMRRDGGLDVIGMVDDDPLPGFETIGGVTDIVRLCREREVDRIIVALPRAPWLGVSEVLQSLIGSVDIAVIPSLYQLMSWRSGTQDLAGMPLIPLIPAQRGWAVRVTKRTVDLVVGSVALVVLSPVLLASIIAVRLDSPGPAVFRQVRAGQGNRPFTILKLRTMRVDAEAERSSLLEQSDADGPRFKMVKDPRVTKVGAILRRYSIDELPQLLNVLSGQMSLVGPRPYPLVESEAFQVGSATSRFEMPPGMTGLWQVSGRSDLSWDDLCRLDAIYVKSWSLWWDIRILMQTPAAALRTHGAY
jgi:exopolysaccharide biosynthesis polyprenyl glycosylphosphotransferase